VKLLSTCLALAFIPVVALGQTPTQAPPTTDQVQQPKLAAQPSTKARVFLQSQSKGNNQNAARDQSMEMSKDFEEVCPGVRVTINQQMADYTVLLNHIEIGLFIRDNQFQLADKNGDLLSKTKEGGSIRGGVKKVCDLILAHWAKTNVPTATVEAATPAPSPIPDPPAPPAPVQAAVAQIIISSIPDGADIEIDGSFVGNAPSAIELALGEHTVVIHKKGFANWERKVKVSGGSITLRAELDAAGQ